jgi:hypothetical protein
MNDHDLHSLFARERQFDANRAPVFQHLQTRARHQASSLPAHHLRWAAASLVAVVVVGVFMQPASSPTPSLAKSLPVLLEAKGDPAPLFPSLAASPDTPSDFLMPRHATFKVL